MPTIVTRASKGSALTWAEGDANINNLNTAIDNIVSGTQAVGLATNADNIDIASTDGNAADTAMSVVLVANQATGNQAPHIDAGLTYNASTNALTATTFVGALTGNADTATTATTATGATNINISTITGNTSDTTLYPVMVGASSTGNQLPHIDSVLVYNASTDTLTATTFSGALSGNATTATTATTATNVTVTQSSTNATYYPLMSTTSGTGDKAPVLGTNFTMNPSTGALTAVSITASGSIVPNSTGGANINFGTSTLTASAWTTLGISMRQQARNYTDSSSTGTVAVSAINGFGIPTIGSSNAITVTEAATFYVQPPAAGTNTTITTSYGLISTGRIKASDFVGTIGATSASTGAFTTLSASSTVSGTGFSNYLASPPAIGGTAAAAGTFTTLTANTSATLKAISEGAIFALGTTGGTIAPNVANGNVQSITLNAALTINGFTSPVAGQTLTLIITGGTAYTSITSTMKFAGGIKTLTATAGCIDILTVYYDGTNYWASLGKDFK